MRISMKLGRRASRSRSLLLLASVSLVMTVISFVLPDMTAASGSHGGGSRGGGGGIGIGIGISITPRIPQPKEVDFDKIERELKQESPDSEEAPSKPRKVVETAPARKLAKPRVPYLIELAMDIDKTLMELAFNEPIKAVQLYKGAIAKAKKKGDTQAEREAVTNLADIYYLTGQFAKATENYESALNISRKLNDPQQEAMGLRSLAAVSTAWGEYDDAQEQNAEALKKFTEAGNSRGIQMVLNNQGVLEKNRGLYSAAAKTYGAALTADKEQGRILALTLNNMGNLARAWGEYKSALEYFGRALDLARKTGDQRAEGEVLLKIGEVYADSGQYGPALEKSRLALDMFARIGAPTDWAKKIVGDLYMNLGQLEEAEPLLKEAEYDSSLGYFYLLKSEPNQAKKHYELLMGASQREGNQDELFTAYTGLGRAFEAAGNYRQAETYYSKGLDVTEEIRASLLLSERKNFFAVKVNGFARSEPAKGLIRVLLKQKKAAQSIFPSEATRAREFADNLTQHAEAAYFDVPKDVLAKEFQITNKLASVKTALSIMPKALDPDRFSNMSKEIKALESERNAFVQTVWKDHREYASVKYPKPVKLEEASVGPDEYVVIFDLLGEGLGTKILKGKKIVDASFTEWNVSQLESDVAKFRKGFENADLKGFDPELASSLYKKLLAAPLERIPEGSSITVLPDGVLALLPFEVLVTGGKLEWKQGKYGDQPHGITYVSDLHSLAYYQSLTAMTLARTLGKKKKTGERILVIADPVFEMNDSRAQATEQEIRLAKEQSSRSLSLMTAIEEESGGCFKLPRLSKTSDLARNLETLYGATCDVYTGLQSKKSAFLSKMAESGDSYKSIVFATHGFASNQLAGLMEPVLALTMIPQGTDGYLTMSEVAGLKMNVDIAALTACQTGTGVKLAGEGIMSMGRAFQCAGAKSVIMSLWSVAEDSSVTLIEEYFRCLKAGDSKMKAWKEARTALRNAGYDHPFFWGAFVLVGETQ